MTMKHNTMYPKLYLISEGNLMRGYTFHGPFKTHDGAWAWAINNMHVGSVIKIIEMFDVKDAE